MIVSFEKESDFIYNFREDNVRFSYFVVGRRIFCF